MHLKKLKGTIGRFVFYLFFNLYNNAAIVHCRHVRTMSVDWQYVKDIAVFSYFI
mgnify:CR=1 FL=1